MNVAQYKLHVVSSPELFIQLLDNVWTTLQLHMSSSLELHTITRKCLDNFTDLHDPQSTLTFEGLHLILYATYFH